MPAHPTRYAVLVASLVAAWLVIVTSASALSVFNAFEDRPSVTLLAAALGPVAGFVFWALVSPSFRRFALSLDPRLLTAAHTWRIAGFLFLVLASYGILPELFALPAGWGDMAIGVTAPLVAVYLANQSHRRSFMAWHALGMLDLIVALTLGLSARTLGYGAAMGPMTVLPLSIVPTFLVPLLFLLHIASIAQAAGWRRSTRGVRDDTPHPVLAG
jgi:hypothetical protein